MKSAVFSGLLFAGASGVKTEADPIGQVISLLGDLSAKVAKDGEDQQKAYEEYFEWCDDVSKEKQNEITAATAQKGKLEAAIDELVAEVSVCDSEIAELVAAVSENGKDLDAATKLRADEAGVFAKNEAALEDVVDTLGRAMEKLAAAAGSASFAQVTQVADSATMKNTLQGLSAIMDAAALSVGDKQKLTSLVQAHEESDDDDSELGAPQAANYAKKSGSINDILGDMKDKAMGQLSDLRKAENAQKDNFGQLKQSLEGQIANDNSELDGQKKKKAASEEGKATAEGELEVTVADLKTSTEGLATTQKDCMTVAVDHSNAQKATAEELKVIAMAIKIIKEATLVQTSTSFLQTTQQTAMQSAQSKIAKFVRKLAKEQHSSNLAQLAARIVAMSRAGAFQHADPFVKIRGMITDMITKLDAQMGAEAQEKAYCDEEMSKTEEKKGKLETAVAKMTNKIDSSSARSAELKEQVGVLQEELAALAKEQEEMDKVRADEHKVYVAEKFDLQKGLAGIRKALSLLRDYYGAGSAAAAAFVQADASSDDAQPAPPAGHAKEGGAGGSIISILEVAESDMAKELALVEMEEADQAAAYEETTQNNKVTKAAKDQDVKYKAREAAGLDKLISEVSNDRDTTNQELGTVNAYYTELMGRCVAKPDSYETRKKARAKEIEGLKTALEVLENEAALVQQSKKGRVGNMRGALQL